MEAVCKPCGYLFEFHSMIEEGYSTDDAFHTLIAQAIETTQNEAYIDCVKDLSDSEECKCEQCKC